MVEFCPSNMGKGEAVNLGHFVKSTEFELWYFCFFNRLNKLMKFLQEEQNDPGKHSILFLVFFFWSSSESQSSGMKKIRTFHLSILIAEYEKN